MVVDRNLQWRGSFYINIIRYYFMIDSGNLPPDLHYAAKTSLLSNLLPQVTYGIYCINYVMDFMWYLTPPLSGLSKNLSLSGEWTGGETLFKKYKYIIIKRLVTRK